MGMHICLLHLFLQPKNSDFDETERVENHRFSSEILNTDFSDKAHLTAIPVKMVTESAELDFAQTTIARYNITSILK